VPDQERDLEAEAQTAPSNDPDLAAPPELADEDQPAPSNDPDAAENRGDVAETAPQDSV
jgi:hypothetical protein